MHECYKIQNRMISLYMERTGRSLSWAEDPEAVTEAELAVSHRRCTCGRSGLEGEGQCHGYGQRQHE